MIVADVSVHRRGLEWPFFGAEQTCERPGDDRSEWLFVADRRPLRLSLLDRFTSSHQFIQMAVA
ncbi:hypothetical protein SAMN05445504_7128 [Burkholderia sp. CF099]|jgi:hypothetical protein|nr:hypothetical protein SAMN05445504_7128 [Burkholderia sp. CF099]